MCKELAMFHNDSVRPKPGGGMAYADRPLTCYMLTLISCHITLAFPVSNVRETNLRQVKQLA